jgi:16S rRNA (cytosine1402-N4)-methyltransferase
MLAAAIKVMTDERSVAARHAPVMLGEAKTALAIRRDGIYLDATFGLGGYSRAMLEAGAGRVLGLDRDADAAARGRDLARIWPNFAMLEGRFGDMAAHLAAAGVARLDGIVLDLGISSAQLDDPGRGFAFLRDGPLDMRMGGGGPSAADIVNRADEVELADILHRFGEERAARRIARAIVAHRRDCPIVSTRRLAGLVASVVGRGSGRIDPATRTFQALRIHVNDELGELERALQAAERLLSAGGRLVVVSFHSLEDRIVKQFLAARSGRAEPASRHRPPLAAPSARFRSLFRRPLTPEPEEIDINPRARSAKLRAAECLTDPVTEAAP